MSKPLAQHTVESLKARCVEEGDCWLWQGYLTNKTPQVFTKVDGKRAMVSVRKLLRELATGQPQPAGHYGNTCGNYQCVCPEHTLWKGEDAHMRYMAKRRTVSPMLASKLRRIRVEAGQAKLDEAKAQAIRLSEESGPALAERYGVSRSLINKIKRGLAWRVFAGPWQGLFR